ncbi:MAG: phosphoenolpyruvate synthase [Peptococcaceae bacterium]|nr:phosphoenolpyruvate synthase [Peptococcaceae bacterium]
MGYRFIKWFEELTKDDIALVGGKGANLGELTRAGIRVPPGFCVTAQAYKYFIERTGLQAKIQELINQTDINNVEELSLNTARIREMIKGTAVPPEIEDEIIRAYEEMVKDDTPPVVAVRSSATAEDLPEASFAGQQDTYLNVVGAASVVNHVRKCWASLWTARATYYRQSKGFDHFTVYLSAVVQKLINAARSGVVFTVNPISQNRSELMINASWGLGEAVVSGAVTPDEYIVNKRDWTILERTVNDKTFMIVNDTNQGEGTLKVPVAEYLGPEYVSRSCLEEEEILELARLCVALEEHYGHPQDIEWAWDAQDGLFYILQARPITTLQPENNENERVVLARGLGASPGIAYGPVRVVQTLNDINQVYEGDILVTVMTNPDMVPAMKKAAGIVTDEGGRTCHAAIVSRELGVPCIVGAKDATRVLQEGMEVTVDATRGVIYKGRVEETREQVKDKSDGELAAANVLLKEMAPITATRIYMNLGQPDVVGKYKDLPFDGIGLMRTEFIFTDHIGAHPMYLLRTGQEAMFVDRLAEGIAVVAQAVYPRPVVVRMSDFRTNEFRGLKGGEEVEPVENNPMIGWRGVSRYISPEYEEGFRLECRAMLKVRERYHLKNVWAMLPFVRTTWEVEKVLDIMASEGLKRGLDFKIWLMAEVPSVIFMADAFSPLVDGFSIGSNDLTQLILGADRDSGILDSMGYFDERNEAVKRAIKHLIEVAHQYGKTVSICGQGPSVYPEFTEFLVRNGIDSVSVNPDTVAHTRRLVASVEQKIILQGLRNRD